MNVSVLSWARVPFKPDCLFQTLQLQYVAFLTSRFNTVYMFYAFIIEFAAVVVD